MSEWLLTFNKDFITIFFYLFLFFIIPIFEFRRNDEKRSIFSCKNLFIMFYYIFLAIGPIYAIITNKYSYNYNLFFIVGVCLLLFVVGADFIVGEKYIRFFGKHKKIKAINWRAVKINSQIVLLFAYACSGFYLLKNVSFILQNIEDNRISAMTGNGVLIYFAYTMIPATIILYFYHLNHERIKEIYLYFIIDVVILLLFGFRSRIIEVIFLALVVKNDFKKINVKTLVKCGVAMFLLVSMLQVLRMFVSSSSASFVGSIINTICVYSINLIFIFRYFPNRIPFQHGYTYLINFQQLLPSSSIDMTMWLKQSMNMQFSGGGTPPTIIGEFYINFGFIGMFVGTLFMGMICKIIDNYAKYNEKSVNKIVYFLFMFYIARSVSGGISNFMILMIWFILVTKLIFSVKY